MSIMHATVGLRHAHGINWVLEHDTETDQTKLLDLQVMSATDGSREFLGEFQKRADELSIGPSPMYEGDENNWLTWRFFQSTQDPSSQSHAKLVERFQSVFARCRVTVDPDFSKLDVNHSIRLFFTDNAGDPIAPWVWNDRVFVVQQLTPQ